MSVVNRPKAWRLGPVRKGGCSEGRPAARICALLLLPLLGAACASVDSSLPPAYVPAPEEEFSSSASSLAAELGLALKDEPELRCLALEGEAGRILLVNGTRTVTVAGRRLEASAALRFSGGDCPLLREDAVRIAAAWHEAEARLAGKRKEWTDAPTPALPPPAPRAGKGSAVGEPEWAVRLQREWEGILVHHSASPSGNLERLDRYHREHNGWLMVGYDFVICNGDGGPDGLVQTTDRWRRQIQGAHAGEGLKRYNDHWIGICLVGDFNRGRPTREQMRSLRRLVAWLQDYCEIPGGNVRLHRDVRATECPGGHFRLEEVLRDAPRGR